jgi:hypothetical protein
VRPRAELQPDDPRHGTVNGYGNLGCRCDACRTAHREHSVMYMRRMRQSGHLLAKPSVQHGTNYCYNVGCRCDKCRAAKAETSRRSKARKRSGRSVGDGT